MNGWRPRLVGSAHEMPGHPEMSTRILAITPFPHPRPMSDVISAPESSYRLAMADPRKRSGWLVRVKMPSAFAGRHLRAYRTPLPVEEPR
jgi:hypothetical protein